MSERVPLELSSSVHRVSPVKNVRSCLGSGPDNSHHNGYVLLVRAMSD